MDWLDWNYDKFLELYVVCGITQPKVNIHFE